MAVEPDDLAAYWVDRIESLLRAGVRDAHLIPDDQRVDVEFAAFLADDLAMAERILATTGLPVTDEARAQLAAYVGGNPRSRDGRVVYDLRADFHLDPADLYDRYAFYFEAFPQVTPEVR